MPGMVGSWERVKDIGSGGFGMVVLWRNVATDQRIAIKQCRWGEAGTVTEPLMMPKVRERWQKEVEIMLKLNHRGIVSCMPLPDEFAVDPAALPRLCMEYCEGGDLRRVLLRPENCCGLPELEVRQFLSDITDALGYLHGLRIIHRDLKPENVVLQKADGRMLYKLIDLGYAKELDQSSVCTSFVGTLQYLAPELFLTNKYTCTADYWSLGLVAYEVVTGVRPFLPNLPPAMWMQHVIEKGPSDIRAEMNEDGTVEFGAEITDCNQISAPLRRHLELWLRRLLDWEPRRRGRTDHQGPPEGLHGPLRCQPGPVYSPVPLGSCQGAQQGPVVVFSQLQDLLQRRVVTLFCEPSCQLVHAEIDETSTMAHLQELIARETGVERASQRLCLPGGGGRPVRPVDTDPSQPALQCWAPPEEGDWLVYVFDHTGAVGDDAPNGLTLPPLVRDMMQNTEHRPEYYRQRAVFAQCVFLIQQHMRLLTLREKAQHVHMMSVAAILSHLSKLSDRLGSDVAGLQAASELFLASLACDDDNYSRQAAAGGVTSDEAYRRWRHAGEHIRRRLLQHCQRAQQLTAAVSDVTRQGTELQRVPGTGHKPDDFRLFYDKACSTYDTHRRRPKEQRSRRTSNEEMIRIVAKFLMHRDAPFRHVHQVICDQQEVERQAVGLLPALSDALDSLQRARELVTRCQRQRQAEIWNLMRIVLLGRLAVPAPVAVSDGGSDPCVTVQYCQDDQQHQNSADRARCSEVGTADDVVLLSGLLDSATLETSDAVSENLNLHAQISEFLRTSDKAPPPPPLDGGQMDWSFLN